MWSRWEDFAEPQRWRSLSVSHRDTPQLGALEDHQSWALLCRYRSHLLVAEVPKVCDRNEEVKQRLHMWEAEEVRGPCFQIFAMGIFQCVNHCKSSLFSAGSSATKTREAESKYERLRIHSASICFTFSKRSRPSDLSTSQRCTNAFALTQDPALDENMKAPIYTLNTTKSSHMLHLLWQQILTYTLTLSLRTCDVAWSRSSTCSFSRRRRGSLKSGD